MSDDVIDLTEPRGRRRTWVAFYGWTAVVLIHAFALTAQANLPFLYALLSSVVNVYMLAIVAAAAGRMARRWELWRQRPLRALGVHLLIAVAALACWGGIQAAYMRAVIGPDFWSLVYAGSWMFQLLTAAAIYGASVGLTLTIQATDRESARAQREAQLELSARQAELTALKAQIQPHFLLNALNSVVALLNESPDEARGMLLRLGSLLQSTFERMELAAVPLARELDIIRDYLEVERVRFGDKLEFRIDAAADVAGLPVPPFILQPLVENAVKHGIERFIHGGRIVIGARRKGHTLELLMQNSGNGPSSGSRPVDPSAALPKGRGIDLTERRLTALYGNRAVLHLSQDTDGFTARMTLPLDDDR